MKHITKLLLVTSAAAAFTSQLSAAERVLSPRAQDNQIRIVAGSSSGSELTRDFYSLGDAAKAKAVGGHSVIAASSKSDPDLAHAKPARVGSPKGLEQLRESGKEFQIAPLK